MADEPHKCGCRICRAADGAEKAWKALSRVTWPVPGTITDDRFEQMSDRCFEAYIALREALAEPRVSPETKG